MSLPENQNNNASASTSPVSATSLSAAERDANALLKPVAFVLRCFPRLTETFIAQEICALEERGMKVQIWSLAYPKDITVHAVHRRVRAPISYLPEGFFKESWRITKAMFSALRQPAFGTVFKKVIRDFNGDPSRRHIKAFMQAVVLAYELDPDIPHLHAHHLSLPSTVAQYAAMLSGRTWSFSAHAKDIWLTSDTEKREKLAHSVWGVTCTQVGQGHLAALAPHADHVALAYHGLDVRRFPSPLSIRAKRDGSDPFGAVRLLSVGWAVEKKGYDDLIRALASLPPDLNWQFAHVGEGSLLDDIKLMVKKANLSHRMVFMGAMVQTKITDLMRAADIFVLPCKAAQNGDRDGLPNVLLEAASQHLTIVSTNFSAIPEFIRNGVEGYLVPPTDWLALSNTLNMLIRDPERRITLGDAVHARLMQKFTVEAHIPVIEQRLKAMLKG
jgi:glycosyltransferase involved in cell wall biosynthesis